MKKTESELSKVVVDNKGKMLNLDHPVPGVYYGIAAVDYFKIKALNQSTLKEWKKCREDLLLEPPKDGKPKAYNIFGTQYHAFLLEPTEFKKRFVAGRPRRQSNEDKLYYLKQVEFYGDEVFIYRPKDLKLMKEMKGFFEKTYPAMFEWLSENNPSEVVVIWRDVESGVLCKARIDKYIPEWRLLLDFKTSKNPRRGPFLRDIKYLGYDYQLQFYRRGAWEAGLEVDDCGIVAQSKVPNYIVKAYQLSTARLMERDAEISTDLLAYAEWVSEGKPFPQEMIYCP